MLLFLSCDYSICLPATLSATLSASYAVCDPMFPPRPPLCLSLLCLLQLHSGLLEYKQVHKSNYCTVSTAGISSEPVFTIPMHSQGHHSKLISNAAEQGYPCTTRTLEGSGLPQTWLHRQSSEHRQSDTNKEKESLASSFACCCARACSQRRCQAAQGAKASSGLKGQWGSDFWVCMLYGTAMWNRDAQHFTAMWTCNCFECHTHIVKVLQLSAIVQWRLCFDNLGHSLREGGAWH